jgi:orotate phosphoribosyltransferase-like protein
MFLCTDPECFTGKNIAIFDDVIARGDAMKGVVKTIEDLSDTNTKISIAAVMDKTMQRAMLDLGIGSYCRLFAVDSVNRDDSDQVSFILS